MIAVVMSFIGKISALLSSIPTPVIGGISIALFGVIASSGLKILVENKIDFDNKKNLLIASVILVSGIGGLTLQVLWFTNYRCRILNTFRYHFASNSSRKGLRKWQLQMALFH